MSWIDCTVEDVAAAAAMPWSGAHLVPTSHYGLRRAKACRSSAERISDMVAWVSGEFVYVTEEKADRSRRNLARRQAILYSRSGERLAKSQSCRQKVASATLISQSQMKLTVNDE